MGTDDLIWNINDMSVIVMNCQPGIVVGDGKEGELQRG